MMVVAWPAPLMVRSSVMWRSPAVAGGTNPPNGIVRRYTPAGRVMVSGPGAALAATTASRREQSASQAPSAVSAVLVTVKVAPAARRGNASRSAVARKAASTAIAAHRGIGACRAVRIASLAFDRRAAPLDTPVSPVGTMQRGRQRRGYGLPEEASTARPAGEFACGDEGIVGLPWATPSGRRRDNQPTGPRSARMSFETPTGVPAEAA